MSPEQVFGSRFDSHNITDRRIANFASDSLNRFKDNAIEGQFASIITQLTAALDELREDLGAVNTSKDNRKLKTLRVDEFIQVFKDTMKEIEGVVAFTTGGNDSDIYHSLYPNGVTEYRQATKTELPELMIRINTVLTNYETTLGADLTDRLSDFYTQWNTLRNQQETSKSKVSSGRAARSIARDKMELALHNAICTVSLQFPLNVELCSRFFDFSLLHGVTHHHAEEEATEENAAS